MLHIKYLQARGQEVRYKTKKALGLRILNLHAILTFEKNESGLYQNTKVVDNWVLFYMVQMMSHLDIEWKTSDTKYPYGVKILKSLISSRFC